MPQIPKYQPGQATPNALPTVRQSFKNLDMGLTNFGQQVQAEGLRQMREEDDAKAREIDANFRTELAALEADYLALDEKSAYEGHKDYTGKVESLRMKYAGMATNRNQRKHVDAALGNRTASALQAAGRHAAASRKAWMDGTFTASIAAQTSDAATHYDDPNILAQAKQTTLTMAANQAHHRGYGQAQADQHVLAQTSRFHASVLERQMVADPELAQVYYQANKGEIEGTLQTEIEARLDRETRRAVAQGAVDQYLASGMSQSQALADARKRFSGKDEDEVVKRLKTRFSESEAVRRQQDAAVQREIERSLLAGENPLNWSPAVRASLGTKGFSAALEYYRNSINGVPIVTDPAVYSQLEASALSGDPTAQKWFADAPLAEYFSHLAPSDRTRLMKLQESLRSDMQGGTDDIPQARTLANIVSGSVATLGLAGEDKAAAQIQFRNQLDQRIKAQGITKETPNWLDAVQAQADAMMREVVTSNPWWWFSSTQRAFQIEPPEGVPSQVMPRIVDALQAAGEEVTPENIVQGYAEILNNGD